MNRSKAEEANERQASLASWQAGLEKREQVTEDLKKRSRELQEIERQVGLLSGMGGSHCWF